MSKSGPRLRFSRPLAVLLALTAALGQARAYEERSVHEQHSPLRFPLSSRASARELDTLLDEVRSAARDGHRPVVVFDIDDTLIRWPIKNGVRTFDSWDATPGVIRYAHALAGEGARIVYLTGRIESLRDQTLALLHDAGAPLADPDDLVMSPFGWERPAVEAKETVRARILAKGKPLAFFDNDLANVRLFRRQYAGARVFRVTGHSAESDPTPGLGVDDIRVLGDFAAWHDHRLRRAFRRLRPTLSRTVRTVRSFHPFRPRTSGRVPRTGRPPRHR